MGKSRLEAFSDGVIAIIITIMVLELKVPHGDELQALYPLLPVLLSYVLSFVYIGIYWNNHHHMLHAIAARQRPGAVGAILSPHGGETFTGPFTVQWQASDADNDPMTYLLQYSADGGATWRPLSGIINNRSATVDPAKLPGTTQGKFRVLASDGVNTGQGTSNGAFTMADKAPVARIESPAAGAHYIPGQPVALIGQAMDVEDGALTGNALQWTSNLSGALGSGQMLHVTDLPEGLHTITLTAQDTGGHHVAKSVTILVADLDTAVYLPLLMR